VLGTEYYSYGSDERTNAYRVSVGNMKEKGRLLDLVVDVMAILKCISGGEVGGRGLDSSYLRLLQVACCCECGNEPSGSLT
jgi:hypothetical protein